MNECPIYRVRSINELPHREIRNDETVKFQDGDLFIVENKLFSDNIHTYTLRKILKNGNRGKTNWVVSYTTKGGMKTKRYKN